MSSSSSSFIGFSLFFTALQSSVLILIDPCAERKKELAEARHPISIHPFILSITVFIHRRGS